MLKLKHNCFCAFCKTPRRIYNKKRMGVLNLLLAALSTWVFMMVVWKQFDPKAIIVFAFFLLLAEVFIQMRWRMSLSCRHCGFDPVLYLKDTTKAVEKVKLHLEKRKQDPKHLLTRPLDLPAVKAEKAQQIEKLVQQVQAQKKGLLSRTI